MNWFITLGVIGFGGLILIPVIKFAFYMMAQEEYHMKMTGNRKTEPTVFDDEYGNVWCPTIYNTKEGKR